MDKNNKNNKYYRKVLLQQRHNNYCNETYLYKEEIGIENQTNQIQFIKIEERENNSPEKKNTEYDISVGDIVMVAPNTLHNIISKSKQD